MNIQQVFNKVVRGLAKQGFQRSMEAVSARCMYRGEQGRKCAAGQLIEQRHYKPSLETRLSSALPVNNALVRSGVPMSDEYVRRLVGCCQSAHDLASNPDVMKTYLAEIGLEHGLTIPKELE